MLEETGSAARVLSELQTTDAAMADMLIARDSAHRLTEQLRSTPPIAVLGDPKVLRKWELVGLYFLNLGRHYEALRLFKTLYFQMINLQNLTSSRVSKGMPLVWMSDAHGLLGRKTISRRFLMLTLVEDAIDSKGIVPAESSGTYYRAVWEHGLPPLQVERYAREAYGLYREGAPLGHYPEWVLQNLDQDWQSGYPEPVEVGVYPVNRLYVKCLLDQVGDGTGKYLEFLAEYLLSVMPGCRTYRRSRSASTDYDVVCALEGVEADFRSELGRYFLCECKDWESPADFGALAKFCRVLDSVKSRFGILFSKMGISGKGKTIHASREQLKVFQDRGIVIVVVDGNDLRNIAEAGGELSFTAMLRKKYESVRLDLAGDL